VAIEPELVKRLEDLLVAVGRRIEEIENPQCFREALYAPYVKMSRSRTRPGPMIRQDKDRTLNWMLGLSDSRHAELVEKQAVY
jgi:hypothetical protein